MVRRDRMGKSARTSRTSAPPPRPQTDRRQHHKVDLPCGITTEWVAKLLAAGPDNPPYDVVFGNEPAFPIPRGRGFFE